MEPADIIIIAANTDMSEAPATIIATVTNGAGNFFSESFIRGANAVAMAQFGNGDPIVITTAAEYASSQMTDQDYYELERDVRPRDADGNVITTWETGYEMITGQTAEEVMAGLDAIKAEVANMRETAPDAKAVAIASGKGKYTVFITTDNALIEGALSAAAHLVEYGYADFILPLDIDNPEVKVISNDENYGIRVVA